jgi:hypothetical protein
MTEILTKLVVDLSKKKNDPLRIQSIPLTDEEIAQRDAQMQLSQRQSVSSKRQSQARKRQMLKLVRDALVSLGLTEAQITALLGS